MASSNYSSNVPGASLNNQLSTAPEEEEEFDNFNDETFGNCEGDWDEDEHERLAELDEESFFDFTVPDYTKDSGYGTAERSYRSQEEFLEQSISRLMEEEEEEKGRLRGQPIPHAEKQHGQQHLDQLFGPSSPPALMDTEHLVSPKSRNIWGSPASGNAFQKPANALHQLLRTAKAGQPLEHPNPPAHTTLSTNSPVTLPHAQTLAEIERQMLSKGRKPQVITAEELERQLRGEESPKAHSFTPQVVNHHPQIGPPPQLPPTEESLRHHAEINAGSQVPPGLLPASALMGTPRAQFPVPLMAVPPGIRHPMHHPMTPQGQPTIGVSPVNQKPIPNGRSSPMPIKALTQHLMQMGSPQMTPGQNMGSPVGRTTSTPTPPLGRGGMLPHMSPAHATRLINAYNIASATAHNNSPINPNFGNRMMTPPPGVPQAMPHCPRHPMPQSNMGASPNVRVSGVPNDRHRAYRTNYQRPPPWQQNQPQRHQHLYPRHGEDPEEDEYAGLMTQRDKDFIIRVQMIQLSSENSELNDYYYTTNLLKKQRQESGNAVQLPTHHFVRMESKAYAPTQFEGSLGRLTPASVHNPRHIIDVDRSSSPTDDTSKANVSKELRKFRQRLLEIEKGYILLLDVDDIEKKVLAVPEDNRIPLLIEHNEKTCQLYQYFTSDEGIEHFMQIMCIRKGKKLFGRALPLFSKNQAHVALCILFHHMHVMVKRDTPEDVGIVDPENDYFDDDSLWTIQGLKSLTEPVCEAMHGSDLESLVRLANVLKGERSSKGGEYLQPLLRHQFSSAVVCGLINQAEEVFRNTSPVDMELEMQTAWYLFMEQFADALDSVPFSDLPSPVLNLPLVEEHMKRELHAELVGKTEDKVRHLTTLSQDKNNSCNSDNGTSAS